MDNFSNVVTSCITSLLVVFLWTHCIAASPTGVSTEIPSISTEISSVTAPEVPQEQHHVIYNRLQTHTGVLHEHHLATYTNFKMSVFDDVTISVSDLHVANIPNSNGLPSLMERTEMLNPEVLLLHYPNLLAYQSGMKAVLIDEQARPQEADYFVDLHATVIDMARVRHHLEIAMLKEGLFMHIDPTPATAAEFTETSNDLVRNMRNLYVLQELNNYIFYVKHDINRIRNLYTEEMYADGSSSYLG